MEFETVWNGASWREVPAPEPQPLVQAYDERLERPSQVGAKEHHVVGRTRVRAYLADGAWCSVRDLVEATGLSQRQVQVFLSHGVITGTVEREGRTGLVRRGRRGYVYRIPQ